MHGHGYAPPPSRPSSAQLVGLRVLFVALALISCGFLSWVPMLRLAVVTRRPRDWWLFGGSILLVILSVILIGRDPTQELDTAEESLGLLCLLGGAVAAITYYLVAEIRYFAKQSQSQAQAQSPYAPFVPPQGPPAQGQYGYPAQAGPAQQVTRPTGLPQPGPGPQQAPGAPQRPAPARIDQVRAELDELSSLLRQDGTRQDGTRQDGTRQDGTPLDGTPPAGEGDGRAEGERR
ncbi:hypothetical protein [Streptomyces luteolus]|uniref:Integral membrane protein n=1 Tax=Streptomyces luteolus TaxID=3043615 RepID=A0ABT6T264_9ACTN|nr:hypothetical protein [Streptomyces sp. B-S-A12]MDI3421965.1 hypothetical protein [Streptomyces sp. B-S-A12]